jgi:hypothetical protein
MAVKYLEWASREATERLWIHVMAVANPGVVVGVMANSIDSPMLQVKQFGIDMTMDEDYHLHSGDLVSFPVTCVFGVDHGDNWEE